MFIEEYLRDLRRERFTPPALLTYLRRVGAHVRAQLDANPGAARSIWIVALGFFAADFVVAGAFALGADRHLAYHFFLDTALVIPPAFAFVTVNLGLLRDPHGYRLSALNIPIVLTMFRVVALPGLALLLLERRYALALGVYVLAVLTDVADGWIARRSGQITRLGTVLDPLVDIVFSLTLFCVLSITGLVPAWVSWVAIGRYGLLLLGGVYLYVFVGPVRIHPTLFGRMTGVVIAALVGLLMLLPLVHGPAASALMPLTRVALGVLLGATVVHVLVLGWYNVRMMRGAAEATGRVVGDVRWGAR
ncbi:MAG TPA: CDP-alcohol phosphatidyltransferase family protein [Candidatus Udaeobacter sp.]|jgi:phosphatidylglycerophosphate synthase|nr:CDP-alcohol phosphatidyltransferase family protein [Candidatus Udaeobacter sp.]